MYGLLGSQAKANIILYLGLRGASAGRHLAKRLNSSPTPIFKALRQLVREGLVIQTGSPPCYALNPRYRYYDEIIRMIYKSGPTPYLPDIPEERHVDAVGVYELLSARGSSRSVSKLSDTLREKYA